MIVLGIETAGPRGSVGLLRSDAPDREVQFQARGRLGADLAPAVRKLLRECGLGPSNPPDLVAVDTGPGSYTGLRIGMAAAKGLAFAWGRPLIGVAAYEALRSQAPKAAERVLCALDASRGQVYAVLYTRTDGRIKRSTFDPLTDADTLLETLQSPTLVIGDAAPTFANPDRGIEAASPDLAWPTALQIARLGLARHMDGDYQDPLRMSPTYYRPNDAEERRRKRKMRKR